MSKRFYITTAIDYVNGQPHLGHAYEKIAADVMARSRRCLGEEVFFLTGLDEHGQKVQQAAVAENKTPQAYCDDLARDWQAFIRRMDLSHDDFIRTTQPSHQTVVQAALTKLQANGHLYQALYRGFYSARQETFLTEKDRLPDGTFDPIYGEVIELAEENYYFKLRDHQVWLQDYISTHPDFIQPESRRNEIVSFLKKETLDDLCITRPASRLTWGIPVPFDLSFVTYVWLDALLNYLTVPAVHGDPEVLSALGLAQPPGGPLKVEPLHLWPADVHLIGKDILKFHTVYWPILLKALGLPMPRQVLAHGWWQKDGAKMSKTTGNIVDPIPIVEEWGLDAFRFYVLRELAIGPDGNWTDAGFQARYAAELANGLGNLVNRSLVMLKRYRDGVVPPFSAELEPETKRVVQQTMQNMLRNELQEGLQTIWQLVSLGNQYVDQTMPFKLAKDPAQARRLDEVLYNLAELSRVLAVLLEPFLPGTSGRICQQLNLAPDRQPLREDLWGGLQGGHKIGDPAPLFPRRDSKD